MLQSDVELEVAQSLTPLLSSLNSSLGNVKFGDGNFGAKNTDFHTTEYVGSIRKKNPNIKTKDKYSNNSENVPIQGNEQACAQFRASQ